MKRFVIHIKGCDRLTRMVSEMDSLYKGEYEIFDAVTDEKGYKGISMSFRKLIIENYQQPMIHVFEDDVKFVSPRSREVFEDCFKKLPDNWDIFLGGSYSFDSAYKENSYHRVLDFSSLHNVIIRKSAYDKILTHDYEVFDNIDRYIGTLARQGKLNVYLCDPQVAVQYPGYSFQRGKKVDYTSKLKEMNILNG